MHQSGGKYLEIANVLRQEILAGRYETSERFPSEVALSRRFGTSRPTVERALRTLISPRPASESDSRRPPWVPTE